VLDALGIERAHLAGHSYGGSVAMALAAHHPERFESLILVDAAGPEYPQERRHWLAGIRPLTSLWVRTVALRRQRTEWGLLDSVADDSLVTAELIDEYWRRLKVEGAPRAFWALTAPVDPPDPEIDLRGITLPTLVVWGCEDALISVEAGRSTAALIPGSTFVTLPEVGHLPMEERPAELVRTMREFLLAQAIG
jgi:pimeloyl-ACP methyl ester carboxylesterase